MRRAVSFIVPFLLVGLLVVAAAPADPPANHAGSTGSRPAPPPTARDLIFNVLGAVETATPGWSVEERVAAATRPSATDADRQAAEWLGRNAECVTGVKAQASLPLQGVGTTFRPAAAGVLGKLYLHVMDPWHASGKVIAYGLSGDNVRRAYLLADPKRDLKYERTVRDVLVEVTAKNAKAPDPLDTVVVLELDGEPKTVPLAVPQSADRSVVLHASTAVVKGVNLRYEPEPKKDTLGYWTNTDDWAWWEFTIDRPGEFDVEILQGCGKNSGGSAVDFVVAGDGKFTMVVQDTGGFQNFVPRALGRVKIAAGTHRVEVRVKEKKGAAVMDLRQVTLKPVGG